MSKHTTMPRKVILREQQEFMCPSNVCEGNRNKHKKRAIPSSLRTKGRIQRFFFREPFEIMSDHDVIAEVVAATYQYWRDAKRLGHHEPRALIIDSRRHFAESDNERFEDAGRSGWKQEGGAA